MHLGRNRRWVPLTDFNSGKLLSCEGDLFGKPCYIALSSRYQVKTK